MAFFISAEPASLVAGSAEGISSLVLMLDGCIGDVHMCGGVLCVVSLIVPGLIASSSSAFYWHSKDKIVALHTAP